MLKRRVVGVALGAMLAALCFVPSAFAWTFVRSASGCVVVRSADDTTTLVAIQRGYDYKGGSEWAAGNGNSVRPASSYAWNHVVTVFDMSGAVEWGVDLPLEPGYRLQFVRVFVATAPY